MKKSIWLLLLICSFSCSAQKNQWTGYTSIRRVENELAWFKEGYEGYSPDSAAIAELAEPFKGYSILVFGGTWCGDTKSLLPKFYKTADAAGISRENIKLYFLNHDKESPEQLEKRYSIQAIPTFILMKDGKEEGRIVETVNTSIEQDLLSLLQKKK